MINVKFIVNIKISMKVHGRNKNIKIKMKIKEIN